MNKQEKRLELKKLYLTQFEKFETKVYLAWLSIFFGLVLAWVYGKIDGWLVIVVALFTCFLDRIVDSWRKKAYNKVIKEIKEKNLGEI